MKRTAMWAAFVGTVAVIAALMWAPPYQQSRAATAVSPVSTPPVGTAGRDGANEPDESPATLHDLETVTGTVDPHELIGRTVDFHVKVADINNDTSFWVSNQDNRMARVAKSARWGRTAISIISTNARRCPDESRSTGVLSISGDLHNRNL